MNDTTTYSFPTRDSLNKLRKSSTFTGPALQKIIASWIDVDPNNRKIDVSFLDGMITFGVPEVTILITAMDGDRISGQAAYDAGCTNSAEWYKVKSKTLKFNALFEMALQISDYEHAPTRLESVWKL